MFVDVVNALAAALNSSEAFSGFYLRFGWSNFEEYFAALGESQLMVVDVDHNDSDDRLAIVILAYQMASANAARRLANPDASCTLLLDGRTYATSSGLCMWRTLVLTSRLNRLSGKHGLSVQPILGERGLVLDLVANYLKLGPMGELGQVSALDERAVGTGSMLVTDGAGGSWSDLGSCWSDKTMSAVWVLGGLC